METLGRKLAAAVERGAAMESELAAVRGAAAEAGGLVALLQGELDTVKAQVQYLCRAAIPSGGFQGCWC